MGRVAVGRALRGTQCGQCRVPDVCQSGHLGLGGAGMVGRAELVSQPQHPGGRELFTHDVHWWQWRRCHRDQAAGKCDLYPNSLRILKITKILKSRLMKTLLKILLVSSI